MNYYSGYENIESAGAHAECRNWCLENDEQDNESSCLKVKCYDPFNWIKTTAEHLVILFR